MRPPTLPQPKPRLAWTRRVPVIPRVAYAYNDQAPSIAPDIYLVLEDFGPRLGRAWRETDEQAADHDTLIRNLMDGQYRHPVRIVAFNTAEGWSRDVTKDIADELRRRLIEYGDVPRSVQAFVEAAGR
jgi:hypothetical protein